jgi:predicted O-methyltransferase YrrM
MDSPEAIIQERFFSKVKFSDEREKNVFLSYVRCFGTLIYDPELRTVLEIGGGQSTNLLAQLGRRVGWRILTIDMNPDAIASKIRNESLTEATLDNVSFHQGFSVSSEEVREYFCRPKKSIGGVPFSAIVSAAPSFVETSMDSRKALPVANALGLDRFSTPELLQVIASTGRLPQNLIDVYRTPGDELEFHNDGLESATGCIHDVMKSNEIDMVFLDGGEFSSLVEWEIIEPLLRRGGYVVLHDIFFPKSFKNWLVCSSISANPNYTVFYIDRSTPQGLMIAQKNR